MALVASVDYTAKRIYLSALTANADLDTLDVYREVRALRRTTAAHRLFKPMLEAGGNLEKIAGVSYTPSYVRLLNGCRLVPFNGSHSIRVVRDTFTDDGLAGRDCFDRTPLGASVVVDIDVDFPEIEIREVTVSGSTGPSAESIAAMTTAAVLAALNATTIPVDVRRNNGVQIKGAGTSIDPWGPV